MLLAIGYNVVSFLLSATGERPLSSTSPAVGVAVMVIYALFLLTGYADRIMLYRVLMGLAVLVLGYGGVISHLANFEQMAELYQSVSAWMGAIVINIFGLVLNIFAVLGKFRN